MNKHFQLTYTVTPVRDNNNASADKARKLIANISSTTKIDEIETTLVGKLSLSSLDKRKEAQNQIETLIENELGDDLLCEVHVYLSLMVDSLGKHIEFSI